MSVSFQRQSLHMSLFPPCFRVLTLKNEGKKTSSSNNGQALKSKHTKTEYWWHFSFCTSLRLSSISTVLLCFTEPARIRKIRNEVFSKTIRLYYVAALVPGPQFYLSFFVPCLLSCVPRPLAQASFFSWVVKPNLITVLSGWWTFCWRGTQETWGWDCPVRLFLFFLGGECPT